MRCPPRWLVPLVVLAGVLLLAWPSPSRADEDEEAPPVDFEFYKERIAPFMNEMCAGCHADPKQRREVGRHWLRPQPGRTVRDRHHRQNFETLLQLIEPKNPAASLLVLKPLATRDGGLTHKGGDLLNPNTPQFGALVDWINGAKLEPKAWRPPPTEEGQPDFKYYLKHVEPTVRDVCSQCHLDRGHGRFKVLTGSPRTPLTLEQHYENFQGMLRLVRPGAPLRSRLLQKPLARSDGGIPHKGGELIRPGDGVYEHFVALIEGEPGPAIESGEAGDPMLSTEGLEIEAESMDVEGAFLEHTGAGISGAAIAARQGTVRLIAPVRVADGGTYTIEVFGKPGLLPIRMGFGATPLPLSLPDEGEVGDETIVAMGPRTLCDGGRPMVSVRGDVWADGKAMEMRGQVGAPAAWLSPENETEHEGAEMGFVMPDEEAGGGDSYLLFDAVDADNAKVLGVVDGGRRVVIGVIERGVFRILDSAEANPNERLETHLLSVRYFEGVAVGYLDGRAHVFAHLGEHLTQGRVGALTVGALRILHVALRTQYEVYRVQPRVAPILEIPRGMRRLVLEFPADGTWVDRVRIVPVVE